jgi:spore germination cell wall hydrolase CwlJ-like protein
MIYGESRGEPELGQVSVAYTAINRSGKKTVCDVILAPKQYSIFNGNSSLRAAAMSLYIEPKHKNIIDEKAWIKAVKIAQDVMHRRVPDPTLGATHYVVYRSLTTIPAWTQTYKQTAKIGNHTFFKYVRPKQPNKMAIAISNSLS